MNKIFFCTLLMSVILFSCEKKEINIPIYSYSLLKDDVVNFKLNITKKEKIISFDF